MVADMADEVPGFIPQVLRLDEVPLLRADETVLNAMVVGVMPGNPVAKRIRIVQDDDGPSSKA